MSRVVRTVRGDVPADALGITNAHDHLFFASAALPGQELDDPAIARAELAGFVAAGGQAVVHWTPTGLGGRSVDLAALSGSLDIHLVAATGRHRQVHYGVHPGTPTVEALTERFVADIDEQLGDVRTEVAAELGGARAGVIKIGTGYHRIDAWEQASLEAAAGASARTGAPIAVHLEGGTHGDVVLTRLVDLGVPASRVILGHLTRNPDAVLHRELAAAGAYLAYDGPSRANHATDWRLFELLADLAGAGHLDRLLLGADTTTRAATRSAGEGPGMAGLLGSTGVRVAATLGEAAHTAIFRTNPARAFALLAPAGST